MAHRAAGAGRIRHPRRPVAATAHAAATGLRTLRLDTNRTLADPRALCARNRYRDIARSNDNPYADHWYEKALRETHR